MARIRTVKPELASDRKLAGLPADVRWTFLLCITQADDVGLLQGRARNLLGVLYPVSDTVSEAKLERWLEALVEAGLLARCSTLDGTPLLHVANWDRHQHVDKPHHSVLSRAMLLDASGNNSRMSRESLEKVRAAIRESVAKHSRTVRDGIMDHGSGIRDHGSGIEDRGAVQGVPPSSSGVERARKVHGELLEARSAEVAREAIEGAQASPQAPPAAGSLRGDALYNGTVMARYPYPRRA